MAAWLGAPARAVPEGWSVDGGDGAQAVLRRGERAPGALARGEWVLAIRKPAATVARSATWRARLGTMLEAFEHRDMAPFLEAEAAWRPYAAVDDLVYRRLAATTRGLTGLLRLGFRCNQDCGFCWQDRDWPGVPDELYARWIDEMAAAGAESLTVSGGEPTLHPGLPDLVARATALGLATHLQTNALRLRHARYAERLASAGLSGVLVSLHAVDAALSDALTRAPGTWAGTMAGIDGALAAGLSVALNLVVERRNHAHLPAYADEVVRRWGAPGGPRVLVVNLSQPSPAWDRAGWEAGLVPWDELRAPLQRAVTTLEAAEIGVHAAGSCGFPLCVLPRGSRVAEGVAPDRMDALDLSARTYVPACDDCGVRERCPGLRRELVARFGDRGLAPLPRA